MNSNPYDPAVGNLKAFPKPQQAQWVSILKRLLLWFTGFIILFAINALVELFVLPYWGLENTKDNDIYFISWWIAVAIWFVFGNMILAALESRRTENRTYQDHNAKNSEH